MEAAAAQTLSRVAERASEGDAAGMCRWVRRKEGGSVMVELIHQHPVTHVAWHARGDYFTSVAPTGNTQVSAPHLPACRIPTGVWGLAWNRARWGVKLT